MTILSVFVPIYNEEKYLEEALNSLKIQNVDATFILSDNNSSDKSFDICQSFKSQDERFEVYRQDKNIGSYGQYHFFVKLLKTEFFMFHGAHDVLGENYFENVLESIKSDATISMAIGQPAAIDENSKFNGINKKAVYDFSHKEKFVRYFKSVKDLTDCTCFQAICRTTNLMNLNLRNTISADHVFISHMLIYGRLSFNSNATYYRRYFNTPRGQTRKERICGSTNIKKLDRYEFFKFYIDNFRDHFDGHEAFRTFLEFKLLAILESRFGSAGLFPTSSD